MILRLQLISFRLEKKSGFAEPEIFIGFADFLKSETRVQIKRPHVVNQLMISTAILLMYFK